MLKIYNTLGNYKEEFVPIDSSNIRIYACGPTVYNYAHIGNARMAVANDLLVRLLRTIYPKVTYVSNITDIDDKIIETSAKKNIPFKDLTRKFEKIYNEDMLSLGVLPPDIQPRATDHINEMIELTKKLIKNNHAYIKEDHVLFHVPSFKKYGCLSKRNREEQILGSRVEIAPFKKDPADFVLWKPSSNNVPGWQSPWGFGRPGWHLECSAMSEKTLGLPFDIHSGGMDLTFPHHENEIAQSCGAYNKTNDPKSFAKYWFHNGFVIVEGEKMSKSIGNIKLVHDLINNFSGEVLRLTLLSSHYRQPLNWTVDSINQSKNMLTRLYRELKDLDDIDINNSDYKVPDNIMAALCDDLNTPKALAELNLLANKISSSSASEKIIIKGEILAIGKLIGILQDNPKKWLGYGHSEGLDNDTIEGLIKNRNEARRNKNFTLADSIRDELKSKGIEIEDTKNGTIWRSEI
ncbi:MAG: Cysteine--tRNA ligase [Alphaproteobacteria bacterium MarineAlpha5_Bin8]|nr:MAG: Cysteine--tRNA ligase [Alphaproteobacteria bacterium MarineAlpha5_Bin7]PPR48183.1 MAG: Cysteine--tRNA ligase [Alphaproteobacteria bacterium MarineAlpha5_Bin8]PPR54612.1 MAG: Cysteine--tRNA ligase [Alphaproteobacteria bacterium MarineAlpha5_Bin6]|tara:strand:- start:9312 stop:10700 length:1389 start_codon:yes stop_codon:yes gene_type:complete